jgi:hypothetical protein
VADSARLHSGSAVSYQTVRIAVGAVLLSAAALKAVAVWKGQPPGPLLYSPRWQVAIIEVEILLGLWLWSGLAAREAWGASVVAFGGLWGYTLYLALDGQQTCKCFGDMNVSPWHTLFLDTATIIALLVWRPKEAVGWSDGSGRMALLAISSAASAVLLGATVLVASGDIAGSLAAMRSESITVEPSVTDLGSGVDGQERQG